MNNKNDRIKHMGLDGEMKKIGIEFLKETAKYKYSYNFNWLGRPIIQFPSDMVAMQEIIWEVKPDLIIETGVAHGGSLVFYASILDMIGGDAKVIGIDIEFRENNRSEIEKHKMFKRIKLIEGSSTDNAVVNKVNEMAQDKQRVIVVLDSNHTYDHVINELEIYSKLVMKGSYMVVFDTAIEDMPTEFFKDRPWGVGNNPKTAVYQFLKENDRFEIDKMIENKLLITVAPDGYLKCIRDE